MAPSDTAEFGTERRRARIDHVELEDGTLLVFDPAETEAWIECRSPIHLAGRR